MIPYDDRASPPAPMLRVTCANPFRDEKQKQVLALLDTGSDVTALPANAIDELELGVKRAIAVIGVENEFAVAAIYEANIEIVGIRMERLEVIEWAGDFVVLGRDVLNEFHIILDGQMKQFDVRAM